MSTYGDEAAGTKIVSTKLVSTKIANAGIRKASKPSQTPKPSETRKPSKPVTHRAQAWQRAKTEQRASRALGLEAGWTIFSYLAAGMVAYGAIGWGIGKAVHIALLFPIGMVIGLAISVGFVIYRYGRQAAGVWGDGSPRPSRGGLGGRLPPVKGSEHATKTSGKGRWNTATTDADQGPVERNDG